MSHFGDLAIDEQNKIKENNMATNLNNLMEATKKLKKLLREQKKELKVITSYYESVLLQEKSVLEPQIEVEDTRVDDEGETIADKVITDAYVEEKIMSPKDVDEVALEGEPDLDLIKEQNDSTGLN
jgi:DNA repair protein RadC